MKSELSELNNKKLKYFMANKKVITDSVERLNEMKRKLKYLLEMYYHEDQIVTSLFKLYAEFYNNMLKPLNDSKNLANANLLKYEKKVLNQEKTNKYISGQSAVNALQQLKEHVQKLNNEIRDLSNDIDNHCIMHKQALVDMYSQILEKMAADRVRFIQPKTNKYQLFFDLLTKERAQK